jgi:hypothetical protein
MTTPIQTRKPTSRATRAANATQTPPKATLTVVPAASGKSVTGDNRPATKVPAKTPAAKTPPAKSRPAAQTGKAAQPAKIAKPAAAPKVNTKKIVAGAIIEAGAELARTWKVEGVTKAEAAELIGRYLSYLPMTDEWPTAILGARSDAGRRSAAK